MACDVSPVAMFLYKSSPGHCCYQEKLIFCRYNAELILTLFSCANPIAVYKVTKNHVSGSCWLVVGYTWSFTVIFGANWQYLVIMDNFWCIFFTTLSLNIAIFCVIFCHF